MKMSNYTSNEIIAIEFGKRVKRERINLSYTQEDFSKITGISRRTIQMIENGKGCSFDNLLRILRGLNLIDNFNQLIPDEEFSPIKLYEIDKPRQRASKQKKAKVEWKE